MTLWLSISVETRAAALLVGWRGLHTVSCRASTGQGGCRTMMVAGALTMLLLSSPARSQPTWASRTDAATNGTTAPGAQHVRQVIVGVVENVDVRRWESLRDVFAESVFVDYTSLFGGSAR